MKLKIKALFNYLKLNFLKSRDILFIFFYGFKINKIRNRVSNLKKIKVVFISMDISMWKYDGLYKLMKNHSRFDPVILVAPRINQNAEGMRIDSQKMVNYFISSRYKVIEAYNFKKNTWFDLKGKINPNIIFYTQPYNKIAVNEIMGIEKTK